MSKIFAATALTGGASGALDAIDGDATADGDTAVVITSGGTYFFYLDAGSGEAESSPDIISPDTNAGNKRWKRVNPTFSYSSAYSGTGTFAGSSGTTITIGTTLADTSYRVVITPTADSEDVGAVWVDTKTTTTFKVKCSGSGTPTFDWLLLIPASSNPNAHAGTGTFAGSSGTTVTIGVTLTDINYRVSVTPSANPEDVGAIYISTKTTTTFKVHCTGSGTPTFDWLLID